jgi:Uma2 family endonuclease
MTVVHERNRYQPAQNGVVPADDPFYYGHRWQEVIGADGRVDYIEVPLTQDDFLDPQEGDHFVQGTLHEKDVEKIKSIFRRLHRQRAYLRVYSDLKIDWGIRGLKNPAPDVAVIPNVVDPDKPRGQFDVADEGTKPTFVLEMVSPRFVESDYEKKPNVYEQAGVREYIIIDSNLRDWDDEVSYTLEGYRLEEGRYVPIQPDARGWLYSEESRAWIGVTTDADEFFVIDAESGEQILPDLEQLEVTEQRLEVTEQRAEIAERRVIAETAARKKAERRLLTEEKARYEAEQRAEAEAAARAEAERQMQALLAEVARLRTERGN